MNLDRLTKLWARGRSPKRRHRTFWGCQHKRTTFPITTPKRPTYVVCLDCGKEFSYDWAQMKQGKELLHDELVHDRGTGVCLPVGRLQSGFPGALPAGSGEVLPILPGEAEEAGGSPA